MGGQLWYLQSRVLKTIEDSRTIKGEPMNKRAIDANRDYDPDLVFDQSSDVLEVNQRALDVLGFGLS